MSKKGRLLSNFAVLGLGAVFSKAAVLFMMPIYTAYLTPADFGTADILVNTAVLLLPFASLCAPDAVFRFAAGGYDERAVVAVGARLLLAGGLILAALLPFLALFDILRPYLTHLLCYVVFSVLHSYASHLLRARGRYGLYALQQFFCTLLTVLLAFVFLPVMQLGIGGYLAAVFLADALTALAIAIYLIKSSRPRTDADKKELLLPMLRYAVPLIPTATLWWVLAVSDHYILLHFHGQAQTGIYAAAGRLPSLLTFAAGVFLEAWHFAAIREKEENRVQLFDKIYGALLPVLIVLVTALILLARPLVGGAFSAEFAAAADYVPLLSVAAMFSALSSFLGSVYVVKFKSGASLMTALAGGVVNLALDFAWIPTKGTTGAVFATLVSYIVVFLWRAAHCRRVMPFSQRAGKLLFATVALTVSSLLIVGGQFRPAFFCGALSVLPFWREIDDAVRILWYYGKKMLRNSTKKANRS